VVIPALNEETSIGELLDSLAIQTLPPWEVIVVDAGSRDRTRAFAESRSARFPRFRILDCPGAYPGRARNEGARAARGPWILFLDCGVNVAPDSIELLVVEALEENAPAVCGWVIPRTGDFFSECAAVAYLPPIRRDGKPVPRPTVQMLLITRSLFQGSGGFAEELRSAEDLLFLGRLAERGAAPRFAGRAVGFWQLSSGFIATFRRFRTYSTHNLRAGLARSWQVRIGLYYGILVAITAAAALLSSRFLFAVLPAAAFFGLRTAKSLWRHREDEKTTALRQAARFPGVAALLLVIDLATLVGTMDFFVAPLDGRKGGLDAEGRQSAREA
jgi:glycosyltransferase involved in cell wall biosynthesis